MPTNRIEMLPVIGIVVVFAAILYGFRLEGGDLFAVLKPGELTIIGGAAVGTLITANPMPLLRKTCRDLVRAFRGPPLTGESYLVTLVMLHSIFEFARRKGLARLEDQLEEPETGELFRGHAGVFRSNGAFDFVRDTLLLATLGQIPPMDIDDLLAKDIEILRSEVAAPALLLETLADALPGLGIIAAVLGVVITMGAMNEAPAVVGGKVAEALLGTFLGIALSYGLVAPLAANLTTVGEAEVQYYQALGAGLSAFARGAPTCIAVECARRAIPPALRPDFDAMEAAWQTASGTPRLISLPQSEESSIASEKISPIRH